MGIRGGALYIVPAWEFAVATLKTSYSPGMGIRGGDVYIVPAWEFAGVTLITLL